MARRKNTEETTFAKFGNTFQEALVRMIIEDRVFADQIYEVLSIEFIELEYLRIITEKVFEHRSKYKTHPSVPTLTTIVNTDLNRYSDSVVEQCKEYVVGLEDSNRENDSFIKDKAIDFCKKQKVKSAMLKSLPMLENSAYDEIAKIITGALILGENNDNGHDLLIDFESRYKPNFRNPITTGLEEIDFITRGGLGEGELGVIIGSSGGGKSMIAVHLGATALRAGKNVVHYTLELTPEVIGRRYDACLSGIDLGELSSYKQVVYDSIKDIQGNLKIKGYPPKTATTITLRTHLDKLMRSGFHADMIIVDYGDILKPIGTGSSERRHELESIYEELKGVAVNYNCPVWTFSQTNRSGINAELVTMEQISESYNKCFIADFIMSLSRTMVERQQNMGKFYVAKNRNGPDGIAFPVSIDTARVYFKTFSQFENIQEEIDKGKKEFDKQKFDIYQKLKDTRTIGA